MDEGGVVITATKGQIEDFKNSLLWRDINTELRSWIEGFEIEKDSIVEDASETNPSTASVLLHLGDINGRKKCAAYFLSLPDVFLQILEKRKDDSRSDKTD